METMDQATREKNLAHYRETIIPAKPGEPLVRVRVVSPPGLWYGPSPNMHKLYGEGEELMVPESVFKNSDFHTPRKSVNGATIRGVLELADMVKPPQNGVANDDIKALLNRVRELERQNAILAGSPPPIHEPLVMVDQTKQTEEI